jgi:uncharacterized membrane protein
MVISKDAATCWLILSVMVLASSIVAVILGVIVDDDITIYVGVVWGIVSVIRIFTIVQYIQEPTPQVQVQSIRAVNYAPTPKTPLLSV